MTDTETSAPFADLAATAEAAGATTKRLEKMARLSAYLRGLEDADLARAARFLAGRPFPGHDARTLNVGGAAVVAVLCDLAGLPPEQYGALHVTTGDIGEVAARIWPATPPQPGIPLTLGEVEAAFNEMAATAG